MRQLSRCFFFVCFAGCSGSACVLPAAWRFLCFVFCCFAVFFRHDVMVQEAGGIIRDCCCDCYCCCCCCWLITAVVVLWCVMCAFSAFAPVFAFLVVFLPENR